MSLGGNLSSGYTESLIKTTLMNNNSNLASIAQSDKCCIPGNQTIKSPAASLPSMILLSRTCPPPSPADFVLYPKVAVPSSVRTQTLLTPSVATLPDPVQRFSQYQRFTAVPCAAPLPQSANMAGISKPSSLECNIYPRT
jgi:hypothetical protein